MIKWRLVLDETTHEWLLRAQDTESKLLIRGYISPRHHPDHCRPLFSLDASRPIRRTMARRLKEYHLPYCVRLLNKIKRLLSLK